MKAIPSRGPSAGGARPASDRAARAPISSEPRQARPSPRSARAISASTVRSPVPSEPSSRAKGTTPALIAATRASSSSSDTPAPPAPTWLARTTIAARTSSPDSGRPPPAAWLRSRRSGGDPRARQRARPASETARPRWSRRRSAYPARPVRPPPPPRPRCGPGRRRSVGPPPLPGSGAHRRRGQGAAVQGQGRHVAFPIIRSRVESATEPLAAPPSDVPLELRGAPPPGREAFSRCCASCGPRGC